MPAVLTSASLLQCSHGAPILLTVPRRPLTVGRADALVAADLRQATAPACGGVPKCVTFSPPTLGLARTLTVDGQPVLLDTASGATNGGTWSVLDPKQTKLVAA